MSARSLVLDSNLLLLYIVGATDREYIAKHKRLRAFTETDYNLLLDLLRQASQVIVTPNTLTETSNLARQIRDPARRDIAAVFREVVHAADEQYRESRRVVDYPEFRRVGLTDAALLDVIAAEHTLVTVDLDLFVAANTRRPDAAINFNHWRDARRE